MDVALENLDTPLLGSKRPHIPDAHCAETEKSFIQIILRRNRGTVLTHNTTQTLQTHSCVPVLSMELERRYEPSELRLSPVTESPWPCML